MFKLFKKNKINNTNKYLKLRNKIEEYEDIVEEISETDCIDIYVNSCGSKGYQIYLDEEQENIIQRAIIEAFLKKIKGLEKEIYKLN